MHIPDGYLSPETCGAFGAVMVPIWLRAGRRVKQVVKNRYVPLLALGAAYCFIVMMFNVPIPDGTTAHAVGGVLVAVLLGPEAAVIAVSTALLIQALFFGDGGVLAYGANAFNMAVVMPTVGYGVYWLTTRHLSLTAPRRAVMAGVGSYVGLNVAALCAAVEFGVQPTLFHTANGTPLYAPFHLSQTIPAMVGAHLLVGGVEAVLTAGVVGYLQRANLPVLRINHGGVPDEDGDPLVARPPRPVRWRGAWIGLAVMVALTPIGLLAPGSAFGEASPKHLDLRTYHLDAIPDGLRHYAGFWHNAIFGGYDFAGDHHPALGYLVSALVGLVVIAGLVVAVGSLPRLIPVAAIGGRPMTVEDGATPAWLLQSEVGLCPCGCIGRRSKGSFVTKTIDGAARLGQQAMFADDMAARDGLLQRLDPRVKVLTLLGLLVSVSLAHRLQALVVAYVATLALAAASKLSLSFFVKRVWLFIPLFTGVVVVPATLSLITPGHVVVPLGSWFGTRVGLTAPGLTGAALIVVRVATSISLVVLLTLTTPWTKLLAALRAMAVPRLFIQVLAMAYRYLFHLLGSVTDMYIARRARTARPDADVRSSRAFVAASAGAIFGKTQALADEVHMAMVARGGDAPSRTLSVFHLRPADIGWICAATVSSAALISVGR